MKKYRVQVKKVIKRPNGSTKMIHNRFIYVYGITKRIVLKDIEKLNEKDSSKLYKLKGVVK